MYLSRSWASVCESDGQIMGVVSLHPSSGSVPPPCPSWQNITAIYTFLCIEALFINDASKLLTRLHRIINSSPVHGVKLLRLA